jgi:membrane protease YdiL (CAAX protease family)
MPLQSCRKEEQIQMQAQDRKRTRQNLTIFGVGVLGIAVLAALVEPLTAAPDAEPGTPGLGQLLWLVAPLGLSLLLRAFGGDGWKDLGLRPNFRGNGFWWLVSILVFPLVLALSALIGAWLGGLELNGDLLPAFATALLTGLIGAAVKNLFEEFAWRGYLAPKLYALEAFGANVWLSHALVGLVWGAWHLPFVFVLWPYLTPKLLWAFVPLLLVGTIAQSVVYGEIRLATGSVLPAWVMHSVGSAIGNALLLSGFVQLYPGRELIFSPGAEGIVSIVLMFAVGYGLWRRRKNRG